MSDSEDVRQDEIEELLRQAQQAAETGSSEAPAEETTAETPAAPAEAAGDEDAALDQNDIEALLAQAGGAPAAPKPTDATATAAPQPAEPKPVTSGGGSSHDDINLLLDQAQSALDSVDQPAAADIEGIAPFQFQDFAGAPPSKDKATLELLRDVELDLKIELGRTHMQLEEILKLSKGAVVPLDKLAGDPVDVYVNGRLVARGEVQVLNDNFCVRVAQLLAGEEAA